MNVIESEIPLNYETIKVTQSRIDKGLLAIPVSLADYFPPNKSKIFIYFGNSTKAIPKNFTPYKSSSRECRIGGMKDFYQDNNIKNEDELVIRKLDNDQYRIFPEKQFVDSVKKIESDLERSENENEIYENLTEISQITDSGIRDTIQGEFFRLSRKIMEKRRYSTKENIKSKEGVPVLVRRILYEIYNGNCQVSGFGFLMKNGKSYFEIHHIKPDFGDHLKNLLVHSHVNRLT